MQDSRPWLIARDDTLLGVCAGLGEDFGFNPLWLRIAFAVSLLWNPVAVIAVYAGLGLLVAISRFLVREPRPAASAPPAAAEAEAVEPDPIRIAA